LNLAPVLALCPSFRPDGPPRRYRKSVIVPGVVDGRAVVAKCSLRLDPDGPWRWYAEREHTLYEHFARDPPPVRVPRLIAGDPARGVLVIERFQGAPMATRRRAGRPLGRALLSRLRELIERLAAWGASAPPAVLPTPVQRMRMRADLLEDPAAPHDWLVAAAERCAARGHLDADVATALRGRRCQFAHGDLLLRNVFEVDGEVGLVDWECAGLHPVGWDLALLSVQVAAEEAASLAADPALVAVAGAREEFYRRRVR
jgi:Ser/Thr protein kinase RdoA (MazF antagonist)